MNMRPLTTPLAAVLVLLSTACADTSRDAADTTFAAADSAAMADTGFASTPLGEPIPQDGSFLDPNSASREQLVAAGLPGHVADAVVGGRPFENMLAVDRALRSHVPDSAARSDVYTKLWIPIDVNTASGEEIMLIPGVGRRMRREFEEYRPYDNMARFRREMGKYVDEQEVARLERYVTIR
jgi:hypothetical protein